MKIRLVSIEGKLGDPIYNEQQMEGEVLTAIKDGIEVIIFPRNSIESYSIDNLRNNERYKSLLEEANNKFEEFKKIYEPGISIIFGITEDVDCQGTTLELIGDRPEIENVRELANIERKLRTVSDNLDYLFICCRGNGTESTCTGVYSNVKIIAYKGQILASNLDDLSNKLDYDFDPEKICSKTPYLDGIDDLDKMFKNILNLQGTGLYHKMKAMNRFKICLGISGGLDSTVSLLACVEIFKKYNLPLTNIIGVTMPGLGTTKRTYQNAMDLMKNLGITIEDIDLKPLLKTHLKNISQPEGKFDITFEQTQSRERTQVLLDIANRDNAIMIGTGCMSEFALGWMTYGGDHLSMYAINIGLPKTVVKMYAKWFIEKEDDLYIRTIVQDILDGPVSPELLPIDDKGEQHEKTESLIGDYIVQDFFIYHMSVNNISIKKLFRMACNTFPEYSHVNILNWLEKFTLRYFTRAYKKNCYGDGLQVFEYSVSPWYFHIPSDIDYSIWKDEIEELKKEVQ